MSHYSSVDDSLKKQLRNTSIVCICIAFGYGLFLTTTGGINPYQIAISAANGVEWNKEYSAVVEGRLFGRISSVFAHPMNYGLFLGLSLVFLLSVKEHIKKYKMIIMAVGIILAIFLSGIRSPIGALFATVLAYLLLMHKIRLMVQVGLIGCIGYLIIMSIPEMANYVGSIFSDKGSNTEGSSLELRMTQLEGCIYEIRNNPLFGNGYGWTDYYKENFGDHPVILAFESLIYVVLCNSGYIGIGIWVFFFVKLFFNTKKIISNSHIVVYVLTLFTYYLSYTVITGEYGYMKFAVLFYTLILVCNGEMPKRQKIKNK